MKLFDFELHFELTLNLNEMKLISNWTEMELGHGSRESNKTLQNECFLEIDYKVDFNNNRK